MEYMSDEEAQALFEQRKRLDAVYAQKMASDDIEGAVACDKQIWSILRRLKQAGRFSWIVQVRNDC
jgi:hypothetical protein